MNMQVVMDDLLADADKAHKQHLLTNSYTEHVALEAFYKGVRSATDTLIEGMLALDIPAPVPNTERQVLEEIEERYVALIEGRDETCQGDPTLENLYDELTSVYVSAIYKLKRLKR